MVFGELPTMIKLIRLSASGLNLLKEKVDIDFFAEQRILSDKHGMLSNLFGRVYTNNVISLVGINASGKTTILKLIALCFDFINGKSLNSIDYNDIFTNSENIQINTTFYVENDGVYHLASEIGKVKTIDLDEEYIIKNEKLYFKKISTIQKKKDMLTFNESHLVRERDNTEEFLQNDISIALSITKDNKIYVRNLLDFTNLNVLRILGDYPRELLEFLNPSIESITYNEKTQEEILKFYGRKPITISSPIQLQNYLSSGTIKGIVMFINAMFTFKHGGYVIVDELENHFNREIVSTLIRFFMQENINIEGATLIFSINYIELLDEFSRNDNIYIARNENRITIQKLSNILKRTGIKMSDAFKSDYLKGTAPSYDAYFQLKKALMQESID